MIEQEQRSSRRVQAAGTVYLRMEGREIECVPRDVSVGGARVSVVGDKKLIPWVGASMNVDFRRRRGLPAFSVQGIVVRANEDGSDVGLRFGGRGRAVADLHRFLADEAIRLGIPVTTVGLHADQPPWAEPEIPVVAEPTEASPFPWPLVLTSILAAALMAGLAAAAWNVWS